MKRQAVPAPPYDGYVKVGGDNKAAKDFFGGIIMSRRVILIGILLVCVTFSLVLIGCAEEEDNPFGRESVKNNAGRVGTDWMKSDRGLSTIIRMWEDGNWYFDDDATVNHFGDISFSGTYTYSGTTAKLVVGKDYDFVKGGNIKTDLQLKKGDILTATLSGDKLKTMTITSDYSYLNGNYWRK